MGKQSKGAVDFVDFVVGIKANRVASGGYVTPGAGVNVNVASLVATVNDLDVENPGATNLSVTAGASGGQSVRNAVIIDTTGTISVIAGASATTGAQVAPALLATQALLATVDVPNAAATVLQANINNTARNWL